MASRTICIRVSHERSVQLHASKVSLFSTFSFLFFFFFFRSRIVSSATRFPLEFLRHRRLRNVSEFPSARLKRSRPLPWSRFLAVFSFLSNSLETFDTLAHTYTQARAYTHTHADTHTEQCRLTVLTTRYSPRAYIETGEVPCRNTSDISKLWPISRVLGQNKYVIHVCRRILAQYARLAYKLHFISILCKVI